MGACGRERGPDWAVGALSRCLKLPRPFWPIRAGERSLGRRKRRAHLRSLGRGAKPGFLRSREPPRYLQMYTVGGPSGLYPHPPPRRNQYTHIACPCAAGSVRNTSAATAAPQAGHMEPPPREKRARAAFFRDKEARREAKKQRKKARLLEKIAHGAAAADVAMPSDHSAYISGK